MDERASSARQRAAKAKRVVVKVGTAVLTDAKGRFDPVRFAALCLELAQAAAERELVVVSSGAIALGVARLGLERRPSDLPGKQAAAAVGQCDLMQRYAAALGGHGLVVAQLLLTHADVADRQRYLNARQTLKALLAQRALPVINENDTVSVEEIQFGDNDALAGLVVGLCDAELLVLLSDIDGLFDRDPRDPRAPRDATTAATARLLPFVPEVTHDIEALAGESRSGVGTGGMIAKVRAARRSAESGAVAVIAPGRKPGVLGAVLRGEEIGTAFGAPRLPLRSRQRWIAHAQKPKGRLVVDAGAREALLHRGGSLLPPGLREVVGDFARGAPVEIAGPDGQPFARGLTGYGAAELAKLCGHKTSEIAQLLGYKYLNEIVHRDDLVLDDLALLGSKARPS
ncbi:MAG: glutamate 5-kinase [Deltaproteobacteria bacterium]